MEPARARLGPREGVHDARRISQAPLLDGQVNLYQICGRGEEEAKGGREAQAGSGDGTAPPSRTCHAGPGVQGLPPTQRVASDASPRPLPPVVHTSIIAAARANVHVPD